MSGTSTPASTVPVGTKGSNRDLRGEAITLATRVAVLMVSIAVPAAPFSDTDEGEKLHAAPAGAPEHAKATAPLNPPLGVSVTLTVADAPAATEPTVGANAIAKSGLAPDTVTLTAAELLPANAESPPYSAINDWVPAVNEAVVMVALP